MSENITFADLGLSDAMLKALEKKDSELQIEVVGKEIRALFEREKQ